jgi:hypothetical protein
MLDSSWLYLSSQFHWRSSGFAVWVSGGRDTTSPSWSVDPCWTRPPPTKLECELGATTLRFRKGILFQVEKTIPLENIQDVTFIEGPLLKYFHLSILKFETAGQSQGQAHDMRLIGIIDAHDFRNRILQGREAAKRAIAMTRGTSEGSPTGGEQIELLKAIRSRLDEIATMMRK